MITKDNAINQLIQLKFEEVNFKTYFDLYGLRIDAPQGMSLWTNPMQTMRFWVYDTYIIMDCSDKTMIDNFYRWTYEDFENEEDMKSKFAKAIAYFFNILTPDVNEDYYEED